MSLGRIASEKQEPPPAKYHSATIGATKVAPKTGTANSESSQKAISNSLGINRTLDFAGDQNSTPVQDLRHNFGDSRIVVTGDDILIEYVNRITVLVKYCHNKHIEMT